MRLAVDHNWYSCLYISQWISIGCLVPTLEVKNSQSWWYRCTITAGQVLLYGQSGARDNSLTTDKFRSIQVFVRPFSKILGHNVFNLHSRCQVNSDPCLSKVLAKWLALFIHSSGKSVVYHCTLARSNSLCTVQKVGANIRQQRASQ